MGDHTFKLLVLHNILYITANGIVGGFLVPISKSANCQEMLLFFYLILVMAIGRRPKPEICFLPGQLRWMLVHKVNACAQAALLWFTQWPKVKHPNFQLWDGLSYQHYNICKICYITKKIICSKPQTVTLVTINLAGHQQIHLNHCWHHMTLQMKSLTQSLFNPLVL